MQRDDLARIELALGEVAPQVRRLRMTGNRATRWSGPGATGYDVKPQAVRQNIPSAQALVPHG
jgi:hypothetical protein